MQLGHTRSAFGKVILQRKNLGVGIYSQACPNMRLLRL